MGLGSYVLGLWRDFQRKMPEYRGLEERLTLFEQDEDNSVNIITSQERELASYRRLSGEYVSKIADLNRIIHTLNSQTAQCLETISSLEQSVTQYAEKNGVLTAQIKEREKERDDARKIVLHYRAQRRELLEKIYAESVDRNPKIFSVFVNHRDTIVAATDRVAKLSGYSVDKLIGKHGYSFLVDSNLMKSKLQLSVPSNSEAVISLPRTKFVLNGGKISSIDLVAERIFERDSWSKEYQYVGTLIREETRTERLERKIMERNADGEIRKGLKEILQTLIGLRTSKEKR